MERRARDALCKEKGGVGVHGPCLGLERGTWSDGPWSGTGKEPRECEPVQRGARLTRLWRALWFLCTRARRYRTIYLAHVNSALLRPVITLYMITRETAAKKAAIPLDMRAPFLLNVLDNLLVVHSLGSKVRAV